MVKGLRLRYPPEMDKASEIEILSEIDVLEEIKNDVYVPKEDEEDTSIRIFEGEKYRTSIHTYKDPDTVDSVMMVASTLEQAAPELVKVFLWNENKIVFSSPSIKGENYKEKVVFNQIIEELLRVATFIISEYNTGEVSSPTPVERIRKYISLYVKW